MNFMHSDFFKTIPQYLIPKLALTTFGGFMANLQITSVKNYLIRWFIKKYNVNMQEAREENPTKYTSFNDFFIRHLKPESRPLAAAGIVSPVDGCISEIGKISAGQMLQAKGRYYSVHELLATDKTRSSQFDMGAFATLYLSPKDYHRVHMPMDATLTDMIYVPGKLFSVQPTTARVVPQLFARNERLVVFFDTSIGPMAMVLVGAAVVGAIGTAWHGDLSRGKKIVSFTYPSPNQNINTKLQQAAEMGYFKLGSTVILLFTDGERMPWKQALSAGDTIRFGEAMSETPS